MKFEKDLQIFESIPLALANLSSPPVLAFCLGLLVVSLRSPLQIPSAVYDFLSIYLLLAIGVKGGVALSQASVDEIWLPVLVSIAIGLLIPSAVFAILKVITPLDRINRGALAAHYGSTSLVTFTAGLVFVESQGLTVEGFLPTLLAVMEVPGIILGIFLAKRAKNKSDISPLLHEVFTSKSVVLLVGGIAIGAISGAQGYAKVEPFFGALFTGMLTIFLLQLGIQAGHSLREVKHAGMGLIVFALAFPLISGVGGVAIAQAIGIGQGGSTVFGLLCASASYIAAPAAVKLSLPEAKAGLYITSALGLTFPMNLIIGIPTLAWFAQVLAG